MQGFPVPAVPVAYRCRCHAPSCGGRARQRLQDKTSAAINEREPDMQNVLTELHSMIDQQLVGEGPWPGGRRACERLNERLAELGLLQWIDGSIERIMPTTLGLEFDLELMFVWLGNISESDMIMILADRGLIDERATNAANRIADSDTPEQFRVLVRRAYQKHYNPTGMLQ